MNVDFINIFNYWLFLLTDVTNVFFPSDIIPLGANRCVSTTPHYTHTLCVFSSLTEIHLVTKHSLSVSQRPLVVFLLLSSALIEAKYEMISAVLTVFHWRSKHSLQGSHSTNEVKTAMCVLLVMHSKSVTKLLMTNTQVIYFITSSTVCTSSIQSRHVDLHVSIVSHLRCSGVDKSTMLLHNPVAHTGFEGEVHSAAVFMLNQKIAPFYI